MSLKISCEVIDNEGPNTLRNHLAAELLKVKSADMAVAFFTDAGLSGLHSVLTNAAARGRVRILTGTYQGVTEPAALRWALDIQTKHDRKLLTKLSPQPRFHWKLYILRYHDKTVVITGSANFTGAGLSKPGEFCLATTFRGRPQPPVLSRIDQHFEAAWNENLKLLHEDQIREYARQRRQKVRATPTFNMKKIIGSGRQPSNERVAERGFWRDWITGHAKRQTTRAVSNETDWDKRGYDWYSTGGRHDYKVGDQVLIFDFIVEKVYVADIRSSTRLSIQTPDGRHFVAYKRAKDIPGRMMTPGFWRSLRRAELIQTKDQARLRRYLRPGQWTEFLRVLRT